MTEKDSQLGTRGEDYEAGSDAGSGLEDDEDRVRGPPGYKCRLGCVGMSGVLLFLHFFLGGNTWFPLDP